MEKERPQDTFKRWISDTYDAKMYFIRDGGNDGVISDRNWNKGMSKGIRNIEYRNIHPASPYTRLIDTRRRLTEKLQQKQMQQERN
jgi:hypothetical protein